MRRAVAPSRDRMEQTDWKRPDCARSVLRARTGLGDTGMNRILTVSLSALMLAGCTAGYDKTALPDASVSVRQASLGCEVKWAVEEIRTYSEMAECGLAAERKFFTAIKLKKMNKFEAYAADFRTLAADRDAH